MRTSPFGRQRIAVTLGDPAGVGPEVTLKAIHALRNSSTRFLLLGEASFFHSLAKKLNLKHGSKNIEYFPIGTFPEKLVRGKSDAEGTRLAVRSIETGVRLAMDKKIEALVTAPINKAGLKKAGFDIPGHTEYLAKLSGTKRFEMMLVGGKLRAVLVTRHMALSKVAASISCKRIEEAILMTDKELRVSFGIKKPRIVVCGLNPHAGEKGTIGKEEMKIIVPAVRSCQKKIKSEIIGPLPPDTVFYDAYKGRYDAEICMYHDQGLIPLKMISRGAGVNVTLGLPFVRTSPDHGTAYDIANQFIADPGSMIEAIKLALLISKNRKSCQILPTN